MTQKQTENDQVEESSATTGEFKQDSTSDLVSTTEAQDLTETEEIKEEEDSTEAGGEEEGTEDDVKPLSKEELRRLDATFQQSPRFIELQKEKDTLFNEKLQLQAKLDTVKDLSKLVDDGDAQEETQAEFIDITGVSDEALIESLNADPKGFLGNLTRQIRSEVMQDVSSVMEEQKAVEAQANERKQIESVYEKYENEHPDFVKMWENGEIQEYMDENPGFTPMAAHKVMTIDKEIEKRVNEKVEELSSKKVKNVTKNPARVISGGPQSGSTGVAKGIPPELQDTDKYGGLMNVLVTRSRARTKGD